MIVFSSSVFHTGMLLTKSGVFSTTGPSAPSRTISTASLRNPALARRSLSRTPRHTALPIAPRPHSTPGTCGCDRPRRLPEHWHTAVTSTCSNSVCNSASVSSNGLAAASPPIFSRHSLASISGITAR